MALVLETAMRDALANEIDNQINSGTAPELVFETVGDVEVATIILNATNAFGAASSGVITMTGQPLSDTNATGGTTVQFSIYINAGQTGKQLEGTVGTSGTDIIISSTVVGATDTVELTTFTITVPAS
ncbi:MAG: hypothetical protein ACYSSM_01040 [Planctomycetota bacterium]|jgi:hypothetical protein